MTAPLLDAPAVAGRLGISVDYAYRLMGSGAIAVTRVGRKVRVSEESLAAYIEANTAPTRRSRRGSAA